jgi:hypothetical protein
MQTAWVDAKIRPHPGPVDTLKNELHLPSWLCGCNASLLVLMLSSDKESMYPLIQMTTHLHMGLLHPPIQPTKQYFFIPMHQLSLHPLMHDIRHRVMKTTKYTLFPKKGVWWGCIVYPSWMDARLVEPYFRKRRCFNGVLCHCFQDRLSCVGNSVDKFRPYETHFIKLLSYLSSLILCHISLFNVHKTLMKSSLKLA